MSGFRSWDACTGDPCICPRPLPDGPKLITEDMRKLRRIRQLAEQWAALEHWQYKGSAPVARARADSANDAARILLNVLDGGDLL